MNVFWELVRKDFLQLRLQIITYGILAIGAAAIMSVPHKTAFHFGTIAMIFVMIAFYCHLVVRAVIVERKAKNQLFLMTLPISARQLVVSKVTAATLIFLSLWVPAALLISCLSLINDHWSGAALALHAVSFCSYLPAFALTLVAATISFSEGITALAIIASNMLVVLVLNFVPVSDFMQAAYAQGSIAEAGYVWPNQITLLILAELSAFLVLMALCYLAAFKRQSYSD